VRLCLQHWVCRPHWRRYKATEEQSWFPQIDKIVLDQSCANVDTVLLQKLSFWGWHASLLRTGTKIRKNGLDHFCITFNTAWLQKMSFLGWHASLPGWAPKFEKMAWTTSASI